MVVFSGVLGWWRSNKRQESIQYSHGYLFTTIGPLRNLTTRCCCTSRQLCGRINDTPVPQCPLQVDRSWTPRTTLVPIETGSHKQGCPSLWADAETADLRASANTQRTVFRTIRFHLFLPLNIVTRITIEPPAQRYPNRPEIYPCGHCLIPVREESVSVILQRQPRLQATSSCSMSVI